ncbi:MAG: hypothetical protein ACLVAU_11515 [Ruminococcus sp.]
MDKYIAIKYMNEAEHYPIQKLCGCCTRCTLGLLQVVASDTKP